MKKFKKLLASLMATTIVAGSMSAINSMAASPRIYVDIVRVNSTTYRADVIFENMPALYSSSFYVEVGSGWRINKTGSKTAQWSVENCTITQSAMYTHSMPDDSDNLISFITGADNLAGYDYNGKFVSFYLTKTNDYNTQNAVINIDMENGYLCGNNSEGERIDYTNNLDDSIMLEVDQYIIGDADGSGSVNSLDASDVLTVASNSTLIVDTIAPFHTNYFPDALCAAAPDADQNGYINKADANEIMNYYSAVAVGNSYSGKVGKIDVYETFA